MREMIRDVESQIESMTRSLENMRSVVSRLSSAMNSGESAGQRYNFGFEAAPAKTDDAEPFDFTAAAAALSQELARTEPAEQPAASMAPPVPHPVRDVPRPDVVAAREPESLVEAEPETEWHGVADGASWPIAPRRNEPLETTPAHEDLATPDSAPVVEPEPEAAPATDVYEEASPETTWQAEAPVLEAEPEYSYVEAEMAPPEEPVVATQAAEDWNVGADFSWPSAVSDDATPAATQDAPVAETKPEPRSLSSGWPDESMWSQSFEWPAMRNQGQAAESPDEHANDPNDFRSMIDQVKAEIEAARASGQTIDLDDALIPEATAEEDVRRAEVQRMVEEMRDRMSAGGMEDLGLPATAPESDDEEARREEARRAVEQMRAELAGSAPVHQGPEDASDEEVRDEVRRAVEAAKAELSGGASAASSPAPPPAMDWSHMQADTSGPPVIVVKDNEGRVELASVFDMLNRLDCGESAALLNYTPHSVTIGLPIRAATPAAPDLTAAVNDVFGRDCSVDVDGPRITIQIGTDPKKKRSEDAA
jgi:hypothetical protein